MPLCVPLHRRVVHVAGVTGTVGVDLADFPLDLFEQTREDLGIRPFHGGDLHGDYVLHVRIKAQMDLAPSPPLANPVLAHFPLALAENRVVSLIFRDELVKFQMVSVSSPSIKYANRGCKIGLEHTLLPQQMLRYYGIPFQLGKLVKNGSTHGQRQALCRSCGAVLP